MNNTPTIGNTYKFVHDMLDEELIYIQRVATHIQLLIIPQREKKLSGVKSWSFTRKGRDWLQLYEILNALLDKIIETVPLDDNNVETYQKEYRFPIPVDYGKSTLLFAIKSLTALVSLLGSKIEKAEKDHSISYPGCFLANFNGPYHQFLDLVEFSRGMEDVLVLVNHRKDTLDELTEVEDALKILGVDNRSLME